MPLTTAALCLALNIYHEARSEPLEGQAAVAQVTYNRANHDPKQVCKVVFEPRQFSWANPLTTVSKQERKRRADQFVPREFDAWQVAKRIANLTLSNKLKDYAQGATHYHTKQVRPTWRKQLRLVAIIGQHKFYAYA